MTVQALVKNNYFTYWKKQEIGSVDHHISLEYFYSVQEVPQNSWVIMQQMETKYWYILSKDIWM